MIRDHWHIACRSADLKPGKPKAVTMFDTPLVLWRDKAGQVASLIDRCPHRNMPLSEGRVCDGAIECPYHGWQFRGDGSLAALPSLAHQQDWPTNLRAKSHGAVEQDGQVWVSLAETPPNAPPPRLPKADQPGWQRFDMVTDFAGGVADCLENFLDCPHAAHVHKGWFRSPTARQVDAVVRTEETGAVAEYLNEPREKSLIWKTFGRLSRSELQAGPDGEAPPPLIHTDRFIAPSTSRVDYIFDDGRHYVITSNCTPITEAVEAPRTRVFTHICLKAPFGPLVKAVFAPLSRLIIQQDVKAMAQQQANITRFGGPSFVHAKSDLLMRHIIAWRRALETSTAPPAAGEERHVALRL